MKKILEDKNGASVIIDIMFAILLAGSEIVYISITRDGYKLDVDYDRLPDEHVNLSINEGVRYEITTYPIDLLWEPDRCFMLTDADLLTELLFTTEREFLINMEA